MTRKRKLTANILRFSLNFIKSRPFKLKLEILVKGMHELLFGEILFMLFLIMT